MSAWTLAHNLRVRVDAIRAVYPGLEIGEIGDQSHQAEQSDHNPDARGIVHAIDPMVAAGTPAARVILAWVLADPRDLEYVIHDHRIYERDNLWVGVPYPGSDPHVNHIHISGKHGSVGWAKATGVGYDVVAEAMTPAGLALPTEGDEVKAFILKGFPGTPAGLDGHYHISDNSLAGYHVPEAQSYLGKAFPGAVTISASDCPAGWSYSKVIQQLFGPGVMQFTDAQVSTLADRIAAEIGPVEHDALIAAVRDAIDGVTLKAPARLPGT